ncbi:hypothetical protein NX059_004966 [Plenodomus lindquistii]|nr:hypothetical protein NX059_004966 [Plenodomus lindquistii]
MPSHTSTHNTWMISSRILFILGIVAQVAFFAVIFRSYSGDYDVLSGTAPVAPATSLDKPSANGFTLRHLLHHGAGQPGPRALRLDLTPERIAVAESGSQISSIPIRLAPVKVERPAMGGYGAQIPMSPMWIAEDIPGPDVEDKETIINFANMSENAYKTGTEDAGWMDVDENYNTSLPFGWDDSGIRGHVFSDDTNSTIILAVKGTTVAMFEGNGTSAHDKENDNLFGSCCCGQGGTYLWRRVCDCQTGTYSCDDQCVRNEMRKPSRYYQATVELYEEVMKLYPNANVITTGHSLGGVLASLIGLQHGVPAITFEAYPQALAAKRLGLPAAGDVAPLRKNTGGFHFGHTADPVYMGTCNGASSFCSIGGYAFETLCHTGRRCAYDVVKDWGWRQSTSTHSLRYAIDNVYQKYEEAAKCVDEDVGCVDCILWKYENGTHTKPSTTSTATSTTLSRTRTETCKTPGWWGCRDESTTMTATTSSSSSSSSSTSTCHTPGWFGCKDKTTTVTTTSASVTIPTTTTCTSKGWFGRCQDEVPASTTPAAEAHAYWRTAPTATQTAP